MKAFVINVVGDIGLVLAAFLIFRELGHLRLRRRSSRRRRTSSRTNEWTITAICLLLLVGAFAKSAQLPLHTWLPDAMEGPTPVSSLIHAATMVTAGVYLIARTHVLFVLAPTAADIAAFIGLATLLVAGTIALVMTDLKRAIAYSTMSQIGYMVIGVSIGAYSAGMFHLMTHAFFKALLFMAAGSIIAAMANQPEHRRDERLRQGDALHLDRRCSAAASRSPPSPAPRASSPRTRSSPTPTPAAACTTIFTVLGYVGALLTAIYTFRLIFRVLPGKPCKEAQELIDTGHVAHGRAASTRRPARRRTPTSASPAPSTTSPSSRGRCGWRWACSRFLALFGGLVQVPGRRRRRHQVPRAGLRRLAAGRDPPLDRRRVGRASAIGAAISLARDRHRLLALRRRARRLPAMLIRAPARRSTPSSSTSGTSTRRSTSSSCARRWRSAASPTAPSSASSSTAWSAAPRRPSRGAGGVVRAVQSGFVRSYALLLIAGFAGLALYFLI